MTKFHLLIGPQFGINTRGLYQPIVKNRELLSENGVQVNVFTRLVPELVECDVLGIDSKFFKELWASKPGEVLDKMDRLRSRLSALIWFNTADSTGSIQERVLPYVRLYCKSQLLKNMNRYRSPMYGGRVYTEFFHKNNEIHDASVQYSPALSSSDIRDKLRVSWNYGLADGYLANHWTEKFVSLIPPLGRSSWPRNRYHSPKLERPIRLFLRMQTNYSRSSVARQRRVTLEALEGFNEHRLRVSRNRYFREMMRSQVVVSPFGWGEINIRDYECFCSGAVLLKPSVAHLTTFPDFFEENETYIPYRWDSTDVLEKAIETINNRSKYLPVAEKAQERFKKCVESLEGREAFVARLRCLLDEAQSTPPSP
jgi:hypothetical protein